MRVKKGQKEKIEQITMNGEHVSFWDSATDAAKYFKTSQGNISNACRGERKSAQGFKWRFVEEEKIIGELWKQHPTMGISSSNKGRIAINSNVCSFGQAMREGYLRIKIKGKMCSVHRLVAETWFPEEKMMKDILCNGRAQVDHINKNRGDNQIENLRWVTPKEHSLLK